MDIKRRGTRRRHKAHHHWLIALAFLALAGTATAQDVGHLRGSAYIGIDRGTKITWRLDYDRLVDSLRALDFFIVRQELADSAAALRALIAGGSPVTDHIPYHLYGVLSSSASDSINLQVGVNGVYEAILPNFNVTAYNFTLLVTGGGHLISSFRTDLPALSNADSLIFVRVSRNDAMSPKCAVTIYKLPKSYGPDINDKTVGTFYDMVRFSDSVIPAGTNKYFVLDFAVKRQ